MQLRVKQFETHLANRFFNPGTSEMGNVSLVKPDRSNSYLVFGLRLDIAPSI